jgi:ribosomal protein L7/L12
MDDSARITALQLKVGELERKLNFVMEELKLVYKEDPLTAALTEAANWLRKGNKLEAVRVYQQMTRAGLKESKDAVDALEKKLGAG